MVGYQKGRPTIPSDVKIGAILSGGGAAIIGPYGAVLAGPCFDEEKILNAELDLDEIARGKYNFDIAGHYARPDIFRLTVNEEPQRPVS